MENRYTLCVCREEQVWRGVLVKLSLKLDCKRGEGSYST